MRWITRVLLGLALAAVVLRGGGAHAAQTPLQKCQTNKLKFAGMYSLCRMLAEAKAVRTANAPDYTVCNQRLAIRWGKVEGRPGAVCAVPGDLSLILEQVTTDSNELTQVIGGNAEVDPQTPLQKCQTNKLKFAGKYSLCRMLAEVKAVRTATPPDYTVCNQRLAIRWGQIEGRPGAVCAVPGDLASIQEQVTTDSNELTQSINDHAADCGNAVVEPGEDCEFANLNGQTCVTLGFASGTLSCSACEFDTSGCSSSGSRFIDNADGTITDNQTGLQWEKKVGLDDGGKNYANLNDADNFFLWSGNCRNDGGPPTGALCQPSVAASEACGSALGCNECGPGEGTCYTFGLMTVWEFVVALNTTSFAGHTDWRVPTLDELQTIVIHDLPMPPAVDPALHSDGCSFSCTDVTDPECSCTNQAYWTASTSVLYPDKVWYVSFNLAPGHSYPFVYEGFKDGTDYARAVRAGGPVGP